MLLIKYAADGSRLWSKNFGGVHIDYLTAFLIGSDGTIYLVGIAVNSDWDEIEDKFWALAIVAVDSEGIELWSRQYERTDGAVPSDICQDPDTDDLYIAGKCKDDGFPGSESDGFLLALTQDGDWLWEQTVITGSWRPIINITMTDAGNILGIGRDSLSRHRTSDWRSVMAFVEHTPDGIRQSESYYVPPVSDYISLDAITSDGAGAIYTVGYIAPASPPGPCVHPHPITYDTALLLKFEAVFSDDLDASVPAESVVEESAE